MSIGSDRTKHEGASDRALEATNNREQDGTTSALEMQLCGKDHWLNTRTSGGSFVGLD